MYDLIRQLSPVLCRQQGQGRIGGVLFDKQQQETVLRLGDYRFTCRHDYTLGWSPDTSDDEWPAAGAIIVQTGDNTFFVAGTGVVITFDTAADTAEQAGILRGAGA